MKSFEIDYTYDIEEYGVVELVADSIEEAEELALSNIKELYPDIKNIVIDGVRQSNGANKS